MQIVAENFVMDYYYINSTIYEKNIDKHLKKCNAGKREVPVSYK